MAKHVSECFAVQVCFIKAPCACARLHFFIIIFLITVRLIARTHSELGTVKNELEYSYNKLIEALLEALRGNISLFFCDIRFYTLKMSGKVRIKSNQ